MDTDTLINEENFSETRFYRFRKWVIFGLIFLFCFFLILWFLTRETLPKIIRIATAAKGGMYYKLATEFAPYLEKKTGRKVEILITKGSVENRELLINKQADLAILQADTTPYDGIRSLIPLYLESLYVIVRKESTIQTMADLKGKKIVIGLTGSGMRQTALKILQHYSLKETDLKNNEGYYTDLKANKELEGAIVTTGLLTPALMDLLSTKEYRLLPILDAKALSILNSYLQVVSIPRGIFAESPAVPQEETPTVAMMSYFGVRENESDILVEPIMEAYFDSLLRLKMPILLPKEEAQKWNLIPIHPAASEYLEPYKSLNQIINFFESVTAIKELLFAFGAFLYLLWNIKLWIQERDREKQVRHQKGRLEELLKQTASIERAQMDSESVKSLNIYLDKITEIKLEALKELTHEDLRGDRLFSIFLMQCANLIHKIQMKIQLYSQEKLNTNQNTPSPTLESP